MSSSPPTPTGTATTQPSVTDGRQQTPGFVQRRPVVAFIVVTFAWSWTAWLAGLGLAPGADWPMFVGAFGPGIGAGIVIRRSGGSIARWLRSILTWRVPFRWYAFALTLPLIDPALQAWLAAREGVALSAGALVERLPLALMLFVVMLLLGGGQEEFGWRGWLLPELQRRTSPLASGLLVGAFWALWHLPLFITGYYGDTSFALYVPFIVAGSVVLTYLYNASGASLVVAMVMHAQLNLAKALVPVADLAEFEASVVDRDYAITLQLGLTVAFLTIAAGLALYHGPRLGAPDDDTTRGGARR